MMFFRKPDDVHTEVRYIRSNGHRIPLLIVSPKQKPNAAPGILWIHGGGYFTGMKEMVCWSRAIDLVREFGAVVISPGYRLALTAPYPAALTDCYHALLYLKKHAPELGVRLDQLMVGGESAGGGLCAAVCMAARDRKTVNVAFQMPLYPMLDNFDTDSSRDNHGKIWNTRNNHLGWHLYLREHWRERVSPYASPARQKEFQGLPPAYSFVGEGEPFYRETLDYISNLQNAGIDAAVDIYPTETHGFDLIDPNSPLSHHAKTIFLERFRYAKDHYFSENSRYGTQTERK